MSDTRDISNRKIKIGVIGVGYLGSIHARILKEIDKAELVGVYDIVFEKSRNIAKELNVVPFKSMDELLDEVEAVSCVVPTSSHFEVALYTLKKGKHTFLEKPITTNISHAKRLLRIAESKNLHFQIGYIERFNPAIKSIRGYIREPKFIEAERLSPFVGRGIDVDVILDLMIHDIDILLSFKKDKIKSISAVGVPVLTDKIDIANVRIEFDDGSVANLTASRVSREPFRKIRFFQKNMYISVDYRNQKVEVYEKRGKEILPIKVEIRKENPLKEELVSFIDSIENNKKVKVGAKEAIESLKIALKIKKKIHYHLKRVRI